MRLIFERYLALGSLPALQRDLRERGILTRTRALSSGRVVGGIALTNGPLVQILRNRTYLGEINHRTLSYPGEHQAIIPVELFEAVQAKLSANLTARRHAYQQSEALLIGRIFDDRGHRMTPTYAVKKGMRYRYYVSSVLAQGRKEEAGSVSRIAAAEVESLVITFLRQRDSNREASDRDLVQGSLEQVTIHSDRIEITTQGSEETIVLPWSPQPFRRRRELIVPPGSNQDQQPRPMKAEDRARILRAIARARTWMDQLAAGTIIDTNVIAVRECCDERSVRRTLSLAFLLPRS